MPTKKIRAYHRPFKLQGETSFIHLRVPIDEKEAFLKVCRLRGVTASQVLREAMQAIVIDQDKIIDHNLKLLRRMALDEAKAKREARNTTPENGR